MELLDDIDFLQKSLKYYGKKLKKIEIYNEKFHRYNSYSQTESYLKKVEIYMLVKIFLINQ